MLAYEIFLVENSGISYKSNCYSKDCQLLNSYHFALAQSFPFEEGCFDFPFQQLVRGTHLLKHHNHYMLLC